MIKKYNLFFLQFLVKLAYPRYNGYCFIMYMISKYCNVLKQQVSIIRAVGSVELNYLIGKEVWDIDNTILVNDTSEEKNNISIALIFMKSKKSVLKRRAYVIRKHFTDKNEVILTHNLQHNLRSGTICTLKKCENQSLEFAEEVELSLINSSVEWNNFVIDVCLKSFFSKPKLLYVGDTVTVNLSECGREAFYSTNNAHNINEKMYFKCNQVFSKGSSVEGGYLCVNGKTTLKQTVNVQSYLPKIYFPTKHDGVSPMFHPESFNVYFESIIKAVSPFIKMDKHDFLPVFLLEGRKGIGKSILVRSVAMHLGMNLCAVNNFEVTSSVYAQNETKLRNIIFSAKMCAPSILAIKNFENFGKNNEGEFDERLINNFVNEVEGLFVNNKFPIILLCTSNEKHIPINLRRLFLKTFEIRAPNDQERANLLQWILKMYNVKTDLDSHNFANKLHGFILEDLRALTDYAVSEFSRVNSHNDYVPERYFFQALDLMQSNYNESLGAPKVPQVKWSDVGGLHDVKDEIMKTIYFPLKYPNILKSSGLKRSGILLYGPPGTGKTLLAKAVATECGLCFLSVKGPELLNMYVGQSEQNVREVFERARDASPCIVFFDELDSLAPNRGASGDSGGVMDRVVSQLLAEMDGLNQAGTVYIIGATNRPDLIDPALLRPGRFDKLLYVGPCMDADSRIAVLRALTQKFHFEKNSLIEEIVNLCPENFSGADFYGLCSNAWMFAVRRLITNTEKKIDKTGNDCSSLKLEDVIVNENDFKLAIKNIKPSIKQEDLDYFYKLKSEIR